MRQFLSLFLLLIISFKVGFSQESQIKAFKSDKSPLIDGRLNDAVWENATPFSGFRMVEPTPGSDPTEKTEVRIIYDQNNLFIGIRCYDSEPKKLLQTRWNMTNLKKETTTSSLSSTDHEIM